jgi:hypothetical protein
MICPGENRNTSSNTCPSATLSVINLTWTDLTSNLGLHVQRMETNGLSHGTDCLWYIAWLCFIVDTVCVLWEVRDHAAFKFKYLNMTIDHDWYRSVSEISIVIDCTSVAKRYGENLHVCCVKCGKGTFKYVFSFFLKILTILKSGGNNRVKVRQALSSADTFQRVSVKADGTCIYHCPVELSVISGSLSPRHGASSGCILRRVTANTLNNLSRTADKGWSSSLGFARGATSSSP